MNDMQLTDEQALKEFLLDIECLEELAPWTSKLNIFDILKITEKAANDIIKIEDNKFFHYLFGQTGSGKTEVFLTAAEKVLEKGKAFPI